MEIEKTNHMNLLLSFYGKLLTPKQLGYMDRYYGDDFSLGEIAEEFEVSRQAVYDNIQRSGKILEDYEADLSLVADYQKRQDLYHQLEAYVQKQYPQDQTLRTIIESLQAEGS